MCLLLALAATDAAATQRPAPLVLPRLVIRNATLTEALAVLRDASREIDHDRQGINLVLDPAGLDPAQATCRIWMDEETLRLREAAHALCARLGLGYRIEPHAVVIASGSRIRIPRPPSREAAKAAERIRTEPTLLLIRFPARRAAAPRSGGAPAGGRP